MSTSVANVVSHFPDAENGFTTTLASTISSGATTVPLNSVAGYTNGMPVVFVVDPSDVTKKQTFTGIIDTSGVQVTSVVWTAGTNQTHTGGATVVDYATATHIAMMSKGILVHADQDGTLKAGAVDNAAVLASDVVTTAKILNDNVTDDKLDYPRWWQEIGRTTLTVAGDTITVSSLPARKYLKVVYSLTATGGTLDSVAKFNNDGTSVYAVSLSSWDGLTNAILASISSLPLDSGTVASGDSEHGYFDVVNIASKEKSVIGNNNEVVVGAANAPTPTTIFGKWANTADQITRVDLVNGGTGDYAIGSEVIVLGHN